MSKVNNRIPIAVTDRSKQDLSMINYTTTDFGRIDVAGAWECIPNDDITLNVSLLFQNSPMPTNTYGRFWQDVRAFFVPFRIMCADHYRSDNFSWDNFITGLNAITHPYTTLDAINQVLYNQLGTANGNGLSEDNWQIYFNDMRRHLSKLRLPKYWINNNVYEGQAAEVLTAGRANGQRLNLWKLAAYQHIWWTYYRDSQQIDENLKNTYIPFLQAGEQTQNMIKWLMPRYCCFKKDYFTLARRLPQAGAMASVPTHAGFGTSTSTNIAPSNRFDPENFLANSGSQISMNLTSGTGIPATWLRSALSLQKYLERNNLVGTRLMARFLARFGIAPSYERLNLPEYLGGFRKMVTVGDVISNTGTGSSPDVPFETNSVYSEAGQRVGQLNINSGMDTIKYHANEFGVLMVVHTLIPEVQYVQGLEKEWTRGTTNDKFDYFTPELQDVGDQPIRTSELWFGSGADTATRDVVFGWTRRYEDYCYKPDIVSGDLVLSETEIGMENIHLARLFDEQPILTPEFTEIGPEQRLQFDRIFNVVGAVGEFDHFKGYVNCRCTMIRPMSGAPAPELEEDAKNHVVVPNGGVRF